MGAGRVRLMAREDIARKARRLREAIAHHDRKYYVEDAPEISDAEYDALVDELKAIEKAHPELVTPDSPTQRVGDQPTKVFPPFRHAVPMLSLDNTYSKEELIEFNDRVAGFLGWRSGIRRRAQDRRRGGCPSVRGERPRRRDAGRRGNGRRDHGQPADDPKRPAFREGGRRGSRVRGPRGGLHAAESIRSGQRGARGSGRAALRQSPECLLRIAQAPRPPRGGPETA